MSYFKRIEKKLTADFNPTRLEIRDDSALHAGHMGAHPDGETHFHVTIRAEAFDGMSRVARQRAVMQSIKAELEEHVHALALDVQGVNESTP